MDEEESIYGDGKKGECSDSSSRDMDSVPLSALPAAGHSVVYRQKKSALFAPLPKAERAAVTTTDTRMNVTTDYRGVEIPNTNLFNVTWWVYFAFVVIATLLAIVVIVSTIVYFAAQSKTGWSGFCTASCACTIVIIILMFGLTLLLRWFALMWKSTGCMITLLVVAVINIIFQASMIRFSGNTENPEPVTLPHLVLLIVTDIVEIVLISILLHELRVMRES